jgi:hypothetical protein
MGIAALTQSPPGDGVCLGEGRACGGRSGLRVEAWGGAHEEGGAYEEERGYFRLPSHLVFLQPT